MSFFSYAIQVVANSTIIALGMMASMGVPWYLLERSISLLQQTWQTTQTDEDSNRTRDDSEPGYREVALGILLYLTAIGYAASVFIFMAESASVVEAVLNGTITVIRSSVGFGISATGIIYLGRLFGWTI